MSMPYANEARPDTGLYNAKLGMWFFLAAEAMFFGALFSSYAFLRTAAETWPKGSEILPVTLALLAGVAAILAAVGGARAWSSLKGGTTATGALWTVAFGGFAMTALILLSFRLESGEGMRAATNTFYACWYLIVGLIGAHAAMGTAYTLYLLWPSVDAEGATPLRNRVESLGLYWQLITVLWFIAFACFYTF